MPPKGMEVLAMKGVYEHARRSPYRSRIREYISNFEADNGYAPSIRQIKEGVGLKSTSSVQYHVTTMCEEGLLVSTPFKHRGLMVVSQG